jgi:hypothetical protein
MEEGESSIELLDHSLRANLSLDCQTCMASLCNMEEDELDPQYDNEQLADVSTDEPTADAPQDKDEEHRRIWRERTPSTLNTGATRIIALAYQGILTILLQQSRTAITVCRLAPSQKQYS